MADLAREEIRFFVGRENNETKRQEVVHMTEYSMFSPSESFNVTNGFKEVVTANQIAASLNRIEELYSNEVGKPTRHQYFTFRKDDKVITLGNYKPTEQEELVEEEPAQSE